MSQQMNVPLSELKMDKANVRAGSTAVDPEFEASIAAHGIIQPLVVRQNGKGWLVTDGGKRFAAAKALADKGVIPADFEVPVIVREASDAEARETSLAANVVRVAMHPVDEHREFARLHGNKERPLSVDEIAARFGVERKLVEQRLALGSLHSTVLDQWRNGKLSADCAKALTMASKPEQARILERLDNLTPWAIKSEIRKGAENVGPLLEIVGDAEYEARGGKITRDLFDQDHLVSDAELLKSMVSDKLAAICARLVEDGWGWATADVPTDNWQYGRLQVVAKPTPDEQKQLDALSDVIEQNQNDGGDYAKAQAASDEYDTLEEAIQARAWAELTAEQKATAGCFVSLQRGGIAVDAGRIKPAPKDDKGKGKNGGDDKSKSKGDGDKAKSKGPVTLSHALSQRLRGQMLKGTQQAILADKHASELARLLAGIVATQVDPATYGLPAVVERNLDKLRNAITPKVMNAEQRSAFDPKDYFESAPKELVLTAITEAVGVDQARKLKGKKRSEIAAFALANVVSRGWLPKELRTATYDGPSKTAAKSKGPVKAKAKAKRK